VVGVLQRFQYPHFMASKFDTTDELRLISDRFYFLKKHLMMVKRSQYVA
jgi:hypothetical protein